MKFNKGDLVYYVLSAGNSLNDIIPSAVGIITEARESLNILSCNYTVRWFDIDEAGDYKEAELMLYVAAEKE